MAFDAKPHSWLGDGYTLADSVIGLTTSDAGSDIVLPEVTDVEANPTTGDIRKVSFGPVEALFQAWQTQGAANQPSNMRINRTSIENPSTGALTRTYSFQFVLTTSGVEVSPEA